MPDSTDSNTISPKAAPDIPSIRVGLFGLGRAGSEVAGQLARDPQIALRWIIKNSESEPRVHVPTNCHIWSRQQMDTAHLLSEHPVDFIVDFSGPDACLDYAPVAASKNIGIISAVSAYKPKHLTLLRKAGKHSVVMHSPNITLGINFIMIAGKILRKLAPHAGVEIVEEHFKDKIEVSGTAIRLAKALDIDARKQVNSIRVGGIVGRHEIIFGFPFQTIRLIHDSISRAAFGQGALFALKQLAGRAPGFYTMEQLVTEAFSEALKEAI